MSHSLMKTFPERPSTRRRDLDLGHGFGDGLSRDRLRVVRLVNCLARCLLSFTVALLGTAGAVHGLTGPQPRAYDDNTSCGYLP